MKVGPMNGFDPTSGGDGPSSVHAGPLQLDLPQSRGTKLNRSHAPTITR